MKRLHKLAATAAVLAIVAMGSACSDTTGTEDWWDEQDRDEYLEGYQQAPAPEKKPVGKPKGSLPEGEKVR